MRRIITKEEAIKRAKEYRLEYEIIYEMNHGCNAWEALYEWDLLEENEI